MARKRAYNGSIIEVETYDVDSIEDIKPGEEFAVIINKSDIFDIIPCVDVKKDGTPDVWFNKANSIPSSETSIFNCDIILVFKKKDDNIATELISRRNFIINGYKNDEIDENFYDYRESDQNNENINNFIMKSCNIDGLFEEYDATRVIEGVFNNIMKYGDNPVLISSYAMLKHGIPCKNMFYKVKGDIARYYEEDTKNSDTLKESLIQLLSTARVNYKEHLQKCVDGIKEIADKENRAYDEIYGRSSIK